MTTPAMTQAQMQTVRSDAQADPSLNTLPHNTSSADEIAAAYNTVTTPDFWVWRTTVPKAEVVAQTSQDGTNFIWAGNGFIGRSSGELTAWQELFSGDRGAAMNPSLANVRQAFSDIFSGTGNAASNRTHLAAVSRRKATRLEKLFATGTGSSASPATMAIEGPLTLSEADTLWSD